MAAVVVGDDDRASRRINPLSRSLFRSISYVLLTLLSHRSCHVRSQVLDFSSHPISIPSNRTLKVLQYYYIYSHQDLQSLSTYLPTHLALTLASVLPPHSESDSHPDNDNDIRPGEKLRRLGRWLGALQQLVFGQHQPPELDDGRQSRRHHSSKIDVDIEDVSSKAKSAKGNGREAVIIFEGLRLVMPTVEQPQQQTGDTGNESSAASGMAVTTSDYRGYESIELTLTKYKDFWDQVNPHKFCCSPKDVSNHPDVCARQDTLMKVQHHSHPHHGKERHHHDPGTNKALFSHVTRLPADESELPPREKHLIRESGVYMLAFSNCGDKSGLVYLPLPSAAVDGTQPQTTRGSNTTSGPKPTTLSPVTTHPISANAPLTQSAYPTQLPVKLSGRVIVRNPYGYLPGIEYPKLVFYGWLTGGYLLLLLVWVMASARYWRELIMLQNCIGGVILLGFLECFFWYWLYSDWNQRGVRGFGLFFVSLLLSVTKNVFSYMLVLVASLGWGVTRPTLDNGTVCRVQVIVILYIVLDTIKELILSLSRHSYHLSSVIIMFCFVPVALLNLIIFYWTFAALTSLIKKLRYRRQHEKLALFWRLCTVLVISVACAAINLLYSFYAFSQNIRLYWRSEWWFTDGVNHLIFVSVLVCIMYLWAPHKNSQRYAYSHEVPADDPEEAAKDDPRAVHASAPHTTSKDDMDMAAMSDSTPMCQCIDIGQAETPRSGEDDMNLDHDEYDYDVDDGREEGNHEPGRGRQVNGRPEPKQARVKPLVPPAPTPASASDPPSAAAAAAGRAAKDGMMASSTTKSMPAPSPLCVPASVSTDDLGEPVSPPPQGEGSNGYPYSYNAHAWNDKTLRNKPSRPREEVH
ncbi:unnamed protein product [Vitrella brassicaformis CCMP3155]|uniref:GOST seven transmembrane domain-containing protein n=2 Tax=Vitrella brassicaformis TaxID=1169539 RepID=A0A0G4ERV5_VITBC|nr:unnamed protein product [Vitrella brassicaformis CCMP3155]|eukprot:CEM00632.1 unnamed protein product [Vitrella brassicaformis CCMP3155]